jgi:GAF domain-containing protein
VTREETLAQALVELADTRVGDHDPVEYLYVLVERCVDVLDAAAAGVLLMSDTGLEAAAATTHELRVLEVLEAQQRQGPCSEAYTTGAAVGERDLADARARWPEFAPRAQALGYSCVLAHPLQLRAERLGALNVLWPEPAGFAPADEAIVKAFADMATIGLLHERALSAAHDQVHHLRRALDNRAVVEQAKVLLAERAGSDPGEAFDLLRRYARNRNQRLREVAQRFLDGDLSEQHFTPD